MGYRTQICLMAAVVSLAGCANWRERVGLEVPPPDEFLVVSRAPLQAPPDPQALPSPRLGAPSRVERNAQATARAALAGAGTPANETQSAGEQALVARAGTADTDIRETLETESVPTERRYGLDSVFGIELVQDPSAEGVTLDPEDEAERLRDAGAPAPVAPPEDDL